MANPRLLAISAMLLSQAVCCETKSLFAYMNTSHDLRISPNPANDPGAVACASATYTNGVNMTGWADLTVVGHINCSIEDASYAMGVLEGHLTQDLIYDAFINFNASNSWLQDGHLPKNLSAYISTQLAYINSQVSASNEFSKLDGSFTARTPTLFLTFLCPVV